MNNTLQFAQKALIFKGSKVLVVKNTENSKYNPGMIHLPGGRMNFGENIDDHIRREVFEETGVDVKPLEPLSIYSWTVYAGDDERKDIDKINLQIVAVSRACKYISGIPTLANNTDDENLGTVLWIEAQELVTHQKFDKKELETLKTFIKRYL